MTDVHTPRESASAEADATDKFGPNGTEADAGGGVCGLLAEG